MINTKYNNQSTNRVINSEKRRKSISKPNKKCNRKLVIFIIIIFIIILIAEINILITLFKIKDPNKSNYDPIETEPGYVFSIKKYELKRFSINENYSEDKIINNTFSNLMILYRKAIYDFIVISEEEATEENKKLYNKTYLASVAIAGECINLKNETCEPKRFVDLTDKNNINITELEEIDNLKDFPIYLCLINLTDNNIILSMRCPQALSEVKRNYILSNMKLFRPTTLKRKKKEKRHIMITQVSDGKNILIREKQGGCCKFGKKINTICSNDMNITKDLNNNIISITEENKVKTVKNKNNVFFKNKASELIDLTNETKNLNSNDYLNILNKLLKKLEKYMKMEEYLSLEEFNEIYNENKDINIDKNNIINRKLFEARDNYEFSGNLFSLNKYYDYFGIDFDLNLVNAYPLQDKGVEARNELIIDNNKYQLSNIGYSFDIQGILEKIMKLNIASRYLARKLYNEVGENLNNLDNIIIKNMTNLSTYIVYKNLEEFFNLNLSDMNFLPLDIIVESNNLNNQLKLILNGIINGNLKDKIELLNDDIYNHINKTRLLLNNIYNNFLELEYLLNSPKNKLTEIVTYYLNASSQYNNIIEGANNIFNTYYRKECDIIVKYIDSILNSSNTVIYNDLKNYTDFIDNLRINIENKNITIKNATENDYKNITTNFANSINLIDEIIYETKYKLKKGIIFEDSGFFISNNKIDENNYLFNKIINDLNSITLKLDNDEFIDKTFNEVMINFQDNINSMEKYIYQILEEKLLVEEKKFEEIFLSENNKIFNDINYLGKDILNKIKTENYYYLSQINNNIDLFLKENKESMNQLIDDLYIILSEESLEEISESYDKAFQSSLNTLIDNLQQNKLLINNYNNNLTNLMENNTKLFELVSSQDNLISLEEFDNILATKIITKGYLNKNNIFKNNLKSFKYYIKEQLFIDLLSIYHNTIIKIKGILQSIINNKIVEEYRELTEINFINKNIETKNELNKRLNRIFSDNIFNSKYMEQLNNYKFEQIKGIENIINVIEEKINILNCGNISNDVINDFCINFYEKKTYAGTSPNIYTESFSKYYCYSLSVNSDNIKKLKQPSIYNDENIQKFLSQFNEFFLVLRNKANSFNIKISKLKYILLTLKNKSIENHYLSQIQSNISSLIEECFKNYIIYSYNYYKNDTEKKTEYIFDELLGEFEKNFDKLEEDIINNKYLNNFKYSIKEFSLIASTYENIFNKNITKDIYNTIIYHQKILFNNSISTFYNTLLKLFNSTYQHIINQIPENQNGFNNILNQRKIEINNIFSEFIKKIYEYMNISLNYNEQKSILQIEDGDFFKTNSILIKTTEKISNFSKKKIDTIETMIENTSIEDFSFISSLYLINSQNEMHINEYFEIIKNDDEFIYLNYSDLIKLINREGILNQDDFINCFDSKLQNSNKEISNDLSIIKDDYIKILENIITQYFTKESIIIKINNLYKNKFNELNNDVINQINKNISELIIKIKNKLSYVADGLKSTIVFYSNNLTKINNTIKGYQEFLLNKVNNTLFLEFDSFHQDIINGIYINYIEKNLNEYIIEIKKFSQHSQNFYTLNSKYNVGEIINSIAEDLVNEYKNVIKSHIDYISQKYHRKLINEIKLKSAFIGIEEEYYSNLYIKLKKIAIYDRNDSECLTFDLKDEIKIDINNEIDKTINNIRNILLIDNKSNYNINTDEWEKLDFNMMKKNLSEINKSFDEFMTFEILNEKRQIKSFLKNYINSSFGISLNNILSTSGKDFSKMMILYNENLKLKSFYDKIKNTLSHSLNYYISLYENTNIEALPKDLKTRLYQLNNIDKLINSNEQIIAKKINYKIEKIIGIIKDSVVKHYILDFKENTSIKLGYNESINEIIEESLNEAISDIENNCQYLLSIYLKENFEKGYKKVLNCKINETMEIVNGLKEIIKIKFDNLFILDSDKTLDEINQKINDSTDSIIEYNYIIEKFKLSDKLIDFLNNYGNDNIKPCFNGINNIYNILNALQKTKNQVEFMYEQYYNSLNLNKFSNIYYLIKEKYCENISKSIDSYGILDYEQNLEKEINLLSYLSDYEKQERNAIWEDEFFHKLLKQLEKTKIFIQTLENSNEFENILSNNNNKLNFSYKIVKYNIDNIYNNIDINYLFPIINDKLLKIKNITLDYYCSINITYHQIKNYLNQKIYEIENLLKQCNNITYNVIFEKMSAISNELGMLNKDNESIYEYNKNSSNELNINITHQRQHYEIKIDTYIKYKYEKAEFYSSIINEANNNIKINLSIINQNSPKKMKIDIFTITGNHCGGIGDKYKIEFNSVNLTTILHLNLNTLIIYLNAFFHYEEYIMHYYKYFIEEKENCFEVAYMHFCIAPECIDTMVKQEEYHIKEKGISFTDIINNI